MRKIGMLVLALLPVAAGYFHTRETPLKPSIKEPEKLPPIVIFHMLRPSDFSHEPPKDRSPAQAPEEKTYELASKDFADSELTACESSTENATQACIRLAERTAWDQDLQPYAQQASAILYAKCTRDSEVAACSHARSAALFVGDNERSAEVTKRGCDLKDEMSCYNAIWDLNNERASDVEIYEFAQKSCEQNALAYCSYVEKPYSEDAFKELEFIEDENGNKAFPNIFRSRETPPVPLIDEAL